MTREDTRQPTFEQIGWEWLMQFPYQEALAGTF